MPRLGGPKNPNSGRNFEPGNKFGKGRPRIPADVKEFRKFNSSEIIRAVNEYSWLTLDQIETKAKDRSLPFFDHMIIRILIKVMKTGDMHALNCIMDRIVGRVKHVVENHNIDEERKTHVEHVTHILTKALLEDKTASMVKEYFNGGLLVGK